MRKSIVYAVAALALIVAPVNARSIDDYSMHGDDLRKICHNRFDDDHELCNSNIERMIRDDVEKAGRSTENWDIPADAQLEDLETNVRNYMDGGVHTDLERSDARILVGIVLACRYPAAKLKAQIAVNPQFAKECATIDGKKGN